MKKYIGTLNASLFPQAYLLISCSAQQLLYRILCTTSGWHGNYPVIMDEDFFPRLYLCLKQLLQLQQQIVFLSEIHQLLGNQLIPNALFVFLATQAITGAGRATDCSHSTFPRMLSENSFSQFLSSKLPVVWSLDFLGLVWQCKIKRGFIAHLSRCKDRWKLELSLSLL